MRKHQHLICFHQSQAFYSFVLIQKKKEKKHSRVHLAFLQFQVDLAPLGSPLLLVFLEALLPQALLVDL